MKRVSSPNARRRRRLKKVVDPFLCCYCRTYLHGKLPHPDALTIEHKIPRARGGTNEMSNLTFACSKCNNARGTLDFDFFMALVLEHGRDEACRLAIQLQSQIDKRRQLNGFLKPYEPDDPILTPEQIEADRQTLAASIALLADVPAKKLKLS